MYKIGNYKIVLKEVFAVSEAKIRDGCTMEVDIHSIGGAKVTAIFKSLESDNCRVDGYCAVSFIKRTNDEVDLLVIELELLNK